MDRLKATLRKVGADPRRAPLVGRRSRALRETSRRASGHLLRPLHHGRLPLVEAARAVLHVRAAADVGAPIAGSSRTGIRRWRWCATPILPGECAARRARRRPSPATRNMRSGRRPAPLALLSQPPRRSRPGHPGARRRRADRKAVDADRSHARPRAHRRRRHARRQARRRHRRRRPRDRRAALSIIARRQGRRACVPASLGVPLPSRWKDGQLWVDQRRAPARPLGRRSAARRPDARRRTQSIGFGATRRLHSLKIFRGNHTYSRLSTEGFAHAIVRNYVACIDTLHGDAKHGLSRVVVALRRRRRHPQRVVGVLRHRRAPKLIQLNVGQARLSSLRQ